MLGSKRPRRRPLLSSGAAPVRMCVCCPVFRSPLSETDSPEHRSGRRTAWERVLLRMGMDLIGEKVVFSPTYKSPPGRLSYPDCGRRYRQTAPVLQVFHSISCAEVPRSEGRAIRLGFVTRLFGVVSRLH